MSLLQSDERRFGAGRKISLANYVSDYLQQYSITDLVSFFEGTSNSLFSGEEGYLVTDTNISADCDQITYTINPQNLSASPTISILEKISRIADLHDPELIDINYIQLLADHFGYNVSINK